MLGLVAVTGATTLLITDGYLRAEADRDNERLLAATAREFAARLSADMRLRADAVQDLQAFMLATPRVPDASAFDRFVAPIRARDPAVRAMAFVDPQRTIRHIYPRRGNEAALGLNLMTRPAAPDVDKAVREHRLVVSNPRIVVQGGLSVAMRAPLRRDRRLLGLVQGVFDVHGVMQEALPGLDRRLSLQLRDAAGVVFYGPAQAAASAHIARVPIGDTVWELRVFFPSGTAPGPDPLNRALLWAFGGGLLLSVLFMIHRGHSRAQWLALAVADKTSELAESNRRLAAEIGERREIEIALRASEEKFSKAFHASPMLVSINALEDGRFLDVNQAWVRQVGWSRDEVVGRTPDEVGLTLHLVGADIDTVRATGSVREAEVRYRTRAGEERLGVLNIEPVTIDQRACVISATLDITDRRRTQDEMQRLSHALQQTADMVMITDRAGIIEYVNAAFEQTTGYTRAQAVGQPAGLTRSGRQDPDTYARLWRTVLAGEVYRDVLINRRQDGSLYYEEKTITPLKDARGEVTHFISAGKDITERMQTQERLHRLAYHDVLTNLPNRVLLTDRLEHALSSAHRSDRKAAVLFLDLDRFKIINDTLGHDVGDALLQALAQRLSARVREEETVARLGGDEFAVVLSDLANTEHLPSIARKILDALAQPFLIDGRELFVTGSIGISVFPEDGLDARTLLKNADAAMYRAKEQGRNTYQFYSADMGIKAVEQLHLETGLRRALEREEFVVYYQPQVDVGSGQIVGLEALVRWQHPERGVIGPAHFVSLLEETGLIVPVGAWVLRTACAQMKAWHEAGSPALRLAVNLSGRQFADPRLAAMIERALADTGLPADALELEITESVIMHNAAEAVQTLTGLGALGVRFAIDDFGTGYSSLSYLKRFPIDTLKVDRSFVQDIGKDADDSAIITAIVALTHNLKLSVIAEGVETAAQLAFLRGCGCNAFQGYLFSEPLPAPALARLLSRKTRARSLAV
jgi:diguanylate cyclase (GGDEF)-like protein/PAS domain S-box-containing protein